ncbi:MAG: PilZ domain-containing protein [Nitrospiraceae bacterium]|nr:MAG: PilZ domain-containing protein [Nitrospiraceae bacterium]
MERRRHKRIAVGYKAEITCNGKRCECVIENLSSTGVNIVTVSSAGADYKPQENIELKFEPRPGETLSLMCRIKWSRKTMPHRLTDRLGLEILDPSWDRSTYFV